MRKILIFGNSSAGKSTLAKKLCNSEGLAHLDLDTLAWKPITPPERTPLNESKYQIWEFINSADGWVIEGCYADLLAMALAFSTEIIFLNLPVEACIANARRRPWEPHKYQSKQAQDKNLGMLIEWIAQYSERTDTFSELAHKDLYANYSGKKTLLTSNE